MRYGYARVSSKDQNEARQIDALKRFGVDGIFLDKQSGKNFDRKGWRGLLLNLKQGDIVVVESIDRMGRDYNEIKQEWAWITKTAGAHIVVLDMPLLDTRPSKDLTGSLISDIVLSLLSYVAEVERRNIKKRQAEGIAAAKARGQKFGRPRIERPTDFRIVGSWADTAAIYGVSESTVRRWAK